MTNKDWVNFLWAYKTYDLAIALFIPELESLSANYSVFFFF